MHVRSKTQVKKRPKKVFKRLSEVDKHFRDDAHIRVGLPKGSNNYSDGTSIIMVGAVHEFGSGDIPERSYLRSTMHDKRRQYKALMAKLAQKIVKGQMTMSKAIKLLGLQVQGDVQEKITDIKDPPLKYREGNPLIDTGHLRQSITYVVDDNAD